MSNAKQRLANFALAGFSVVLVIGLSVGADRFYGLVAPAAPLPGSMELIFPPQSRQTFKSIEFEYTAHINRLGLREREIAPKQSGVFRICALGDSYTYGWGVEAEDTWLRKLEVLLKAEGLQVETVNMGKPGSGPDFYSDLAQRALHFLEPDLVVVSLLMGNDIIAAAPDAQAGSTNLPLRIGQALYPNITKRLQQPDVPVGERTTELPPQVSSAEDNVKWTRNTAQEFLSKMGEKERAAYAKVDEKVRTAFESGLFNPYMVDLALKNPENYNHTLRLDDSWIEQCISAVSGHLDIIEKAAAAAGAPTVVLAMPDGPYVNDHARQGILKVGYAIPENAVDSDGPDSAVRMAAERAGLPFISATETIKQHRDDPGLYFEFDGHMTAKGHSLFAEAIAPELGKIIRDAGAR